MGRSPRDGGFVDTAFPGEGVGGGVAAMVPGVSRVNSEEGAVPWKTETGQI